MRCGSELRSSESGSRLRSQGQQREAEVCSAFVRWPIALADRSMRPKKDLAAEPEVDVVDLHLGKLELEAGMAEERVVVPATAAESVAESVVGTMEPPGRAQKPAV